MISYVSFCGTNFQEAKYSGSQILIQCRLVDSTYWASLGPWVVVLVEQCVSHVDSDVTSWLFSRLILPLKAHSLMSNRGRSQKF